MSTELETSYGGVVLRGDELLVITPAGKRVTGLPKGGMEDGETPEEVAARGQFDHVLLLSRRSVRGRPRHERSAFPAPE